jgi:hypothetical protein
VLYRSVVQRQPDVSEEHTASTLSSDSRLLSGVLLGLLLDPGDDGRDMFLRNIGLSLNYTVWQPERPF